MPTFLVDQATDTRVVHLDGHTGLGKDVLGGKAWSIDHMRAVGIPVPPAFAATTACCHDYYSAGRTLDEGLWERIVASVAWLEDQTGHRFGGSDTPLLVSVRSGAPVSMPGMMDTVLNLGINHDIERALAASTGDAAYAADTHRRFREQYRHVVMGGEGGPIPGDPWAQLRAAICAVFDSWNSPRAQAYRQSRRLSEDGGTAVTVQAMVFGNLDDRSGTGVLFSRNPLTGERPAYGEWLTRGQGEDVVSGRVDPLPLSALHHVLPTVHDELLGYADQLEKLGRDIQDIEFTVESGRLWVLQCRPAKRSARAALRAAVSMAEEGLISTEEAVGRIGPDQVRHLLRPLLQDHDAVPVHTGEPACPGIATGVVVIDPDEAEERGADGEAVILARVTTSPEDLHGMLGARAVITEQGGATSHAAVVSREIHRPCIVGCGPATVTALEGKVVTIDGERGKIWLGELELESPGEHTIDDFAHLYEWGSALLPLTVHRLSQQPQGVVDLDELGADWRRGMTPGAHVRGEVLETDEALEFALATGVASVSVPYALPIVMTLLDLVDAGRG